MKEYSRELAKFVANLKYENIEGEVVEKTKMHILDTMGVSLGAYDQPWSQMVIELVAQFQGSEESKVMGLDGKYPSAMAALANGTMAHGIDMDDSGSEGWAHPGACIVPAAFAAAEIEGITGKELLTAILAGYEINGRLDGALFPSLRDKGFHATAVIGTIGAVTAAGKALNLNEEAMMNAFGLAGTQAAGLEEWLTAGDMSKRLHAGKAAMNGVLSVLLARKGYTGPKTVFEGNYGLLETHSEEYDISKLTEGLGEEFSIMTAKFKPYACCHELCGPIRLALKAKKEHGIEPEDVKQIKIGLNHVTAENQLKVAETPLHAQNHPAVAVAIALVEGEMLMRQFFENYSGPKIEELGRKTEVYVDEEIEDEFPEKVGTRLTIITKDGTFTYFEKSKPPVSYDYIKEKFENLALHQLPENNVDTLLNMVEDLENIEDITEITEYLS